MMHSLDTIFSFFVIFILNEIAFSNCKKLSHSPFCKMILPNCKINGRTDNIGRENQKGRRQPYHLPFHINMLQKADEFKIMKKSIVLSLLPQIKQREKKMSEVIQFLLISFGCLGKFTIRKPHQM